MQIELLRIIAEYNGDVVLVTHSRDEAYRICDKLLIMEDGFIRRGGGTKAVFADPGNVTAARVTGCKNISRIRRLSEHRLFAVDWGVELVTDRKVEDHHTHIGVRAHDFSRTSSAANEIAVAVERVIEGPFEQTVLLSVRGNARENIRWICGRNEDVSDVNRVFLSGGDILLLTSDIVVASSRNVL
jgi:molybdate transport system ATP-binding protein